MDNMTLAETLMMGIPVKDVWVHIPTGAERMHIREITDKDVVEELVRVGRLVVVDVEEYDVPDENYSSGVSAKLIAYYSLAESVEYTKGKDKYAIITNVDIDHDEG